ncbi:MAG: adenylyltransferase/cytidyltransferase family protein [Planctomycetes bacterium]|nr:adenylyltransferase/cytidyltransferase family protein [Planctomycetota bacterium]
MVVIPRKQRSKDKVIPDRRSLGLILNGLRASGKTIILTNGVFDLLHVGHTRCLEDARSRGDYLVVACNSDKSAEALKGKGRPVLPLAERMEMLSALSFVDYVTAFEEETADALLEQLQPTLYAKGTDYTIKTLPERDTIKALGIKAVFVGDKKGHSTAKLIQKVQKMQTAAGAAKKVAKPAAKKAVGKKTARKAAR